ncbi:MAG TPA: benzoylsuccinyl-CoA thiolase, partial [Halieaceae bacterium]|nr:benzoylsuccinyl-CoA thiolase [Halieaceae bacterium]
TLEEEQMTVLGQVVTGVNVSDLKVGMAMELVLEPLHETDDDIKMTWKWRPLAEQGEQH